MSKNIDVSALLLKPLSSPEWAQSRDGLTSKWSGPRATFDAPVLLEPPFEKSSSRVLMAGWVGVLKRATVNRNGSNPYGFENTELLIERGKEKDRLMLLRL